MISLSDLVKRPDSALSEKQIELVKKWIEEDWEAADVNREILNLIKRLVTTIDSMGKTINSMEKEIQGLEADQPF